jgi:hypothetical protein
MHNNTQINYGDNNNDVNDDDLGSEEWIHQLSLSTTMHYNTQINNDGDNNNDDNDEDFGSEEWLHQLSLSTTIHNMTFLCNRALCVTEAAARRASFVTMFWDGDEDKDKVVHRQRKSYDGRELCQVFVIRCKYTVCIMSQIYLLPCFAYSVRKEPLLGNTDSASSYQFPKADAALLN